MSEIIIIDGANIYECTYSTKGVDGCWYCEENLYDDGSPVCKCKENKDCYYKQLKRLQEKYDTVVNKFFNSETDKTRLQAENEELKAGLCKQCDFQKQYFSETKKLLANNNSLCNKIQIYEADEARMRKALEEIQRVAEEQIKRYPGSFKIKDAEYYTIIEICDEVLK